ncbi:MAG: DUF1800 domain-containing protein [Alphaproteobacteria bacterium]|nr:DUF1800 domain-containing protein [Alphaproteobacteria bacterium]
MDLQAEVHVEAEAGDSPPSRTAPAGFVAAAAAILTACGGGGGGSTGGVVTPPATGGGQTQQSLTAADASRFLGQASMGANRAEIDRVRGQGLAAWLDEQFAMSRQIGHWDWLVANGFNVPANQNNTAGFDAMMWRQLIASPDTLRQRVGMALLNFLVVGIDGVTGSWRQFTMAAYMDILWDNAFGNFRTLLERISTNAAMGLYLTFLGNRKANPATGAVPDENYARELMQLFTIGLLRLNPDGTAQTQETYTQDDVSGLARVFTGWTLDSTDNTTPDRYRRPMINNPANHETGAKTFLGTTIPAGTSGPESLRLALDAIFAHPNVPPFVSKQLIQRLVTSNPSPAYVGRIAAVFANNGSGVRGDLRAVIRAILLDPEARDSATAQASQSFGRLREPVMRLTGWARAYGINSPANTWAFGDTSSSSTRLAQSPGRSPSVFNFFRPGYTPPNSAIGSAGLVAPEFQITNEPSVVAYINYMIALVTNGAGDAVPDYSPLLAIADNSAALVDEVNLVLAAGQLSAATVAAIRSAVDSTATTATNGPLLRVRTAVLLTLAAPEYLTLK